MEVFIFDKQVSFLEKKDLTINSEPQVLFRRSVNPFESLK